MHDINKIYFHVLGRTNKYLTENREEKKKKEKVTKF